MTISRARALARLCSGVLHAPCLSADVAEKPPANGQDPRHCFSNCVDVKLPAEFCFVQRKKECCSNFGVQRDLIRLHMSRAFVKMQSENSSSDILSPISDAMYEDPSHSASRAGSESIVEIDGHAFDNW